jgi:hypothetical protein
MPDYEKYGFKNTVVDKLINRPVFNANKMPAKKSAQPRNLESFAKTVNAPYTGPTMLGESSVMSYVGGAAASGVKGIIKLAAKNLAKKGVIKGASKSFD